MLEIANQDEPILPRPWMSNTASETQDQVERLSVKSSRPLIAMSVTKMFDQLHQEYNFSDRNAEHCTIRYCRSLQMYSRVRTFSAAFVEWRQHKDLNFELTRIEQHVGLQATPAVADDTTQTSWFRSVNSALQYEPIELTPAQRRDAMESQGLQLFLKRVVPRVELALQQNETLDVFIDPFDNLFDEEDALVDKSHEETTIREVRSFTDLVYTKNKSLPAIEWHPTRQNVVAVAAAANASFSKRLELVDPLEQSYVLLWTFIDLIHPQLLLESSHDVLTMRFNPVTPHLVAAGLFNGQVLVWDLSQVEFVLTTVQSPATRSNIRTTRIRSSVSSKISSSEDGKTPIPRLQPLYVSSIAVSHRRPVADLHWLPVGTEVTSRGHIIASTGVDAQAVTQFVTIAADGQVSFWDIRVINATSRGQSSPSRAKSPASDVAFAPIYSISLTKGDSPGELTLRTLWLEISRNDFNRTNQVSALSSHFYCGTEEGELISADWRPHVSTQRNAGRKDDERRETDAEYVQWIARDKVGRPLFGLCASPFFSTIFLTASDSQFHLWNISPQHEKESSSDERNAIAATHCQVFVSPLTMTSITCVAFSPSRPGVIFVGKSDGILEIWDFVDQSHRASFSISVSANALTSMKFRPQRNGNASNTLSVSATLTIGNKANGIDSKHQLVAVGDESGNLHILELPRTLVRPTNGERTTMESFFQRESERLQDILAGLQSNNSSRVERSGPNVRLKRGHDVTALDTAETRNSTNLETTLSLNDDVFKQMEKEFCNEMGIEATRSA